MRKYETMVIASPNLDEEGINALIEDIKALIEKQGGEITSVDLWGLRRLEYPIKREENGQYAVLNYQSEGNPARELQGALSIREDVLRVKTFLRERE
ncbi:MAG: 30S ribosomal protein S6 [Actinomycetota bacterium]|nr:30S ribosomal protein S6 [Actinomycetota bacterium]